MICFLRDNVIFGIYHETAMIYFVTSVNRDRKRVLTFPI